MARQSTWPVSTAPDGTYLRAPRYYGTCDDDADTTIAGVLQVLTEAEYNAAKTAEHEARRPYPSWIGYLDTMTWAAPVARPADAIMNGGNVRYQWDEATVNWVATGIKDERVFLHLWFAKVRLNPALGYSCVRTLSSTQTSPHPYKAWWHQPSTSLREVRAIT
jgi:hypothetical protein